MPVEVQGQGSVESVQALPRTSLFHSSEGYKYFEAAIIFDRRAKNAFSKMQPQT